MADPLIKDPKLVFPDNKHDIEHMCRPVIQYVMKVCTLGPVIQYIMKVCMLGPVIQYIMKVCMLGPVLQYIMKVCMLGPVIQYIMKVCMLGPVIQYVMKVCMLGPVIQLWGQFKSCVQQYTHSCFTESRRQDFDKAVEGSMEYVRQICEVSHYQTEYLKHAPCIKSTLTRAEHCGKHYQYLVSQVSRDVSNSKLCCPHQRFRTCVLQETRRQCDGGADGGKAFKFARQILDKALSFIREQCLNYIPSAGECPGLGLTPADRTDNIHHYRTDTTSSDYPRHTDMMSTDQHRTDTISPDQFQRPTNTHNTRPWRPSVETVDRRVTDFPESGAGGRRGSTADEPWMPDVSSTDDQRGTSRVSWTPGGRGTSSQPGSDKPSSPWYPGHADTAAGSSRHSPSLTPPDPTAPMEAGRSSSWGRGVTWGYSITTDSWYPSLGDSSNTVDEPNQQGLSNQYKNTGTGPTSIFLFYILAALVVSEWGCLM
uniref:(California timema) hypothetical protein n=1 Tax=Timema californicum TaxID=61474 RepID=A0A7R9JGZ6_TIMCA|nr:unnamed protein product [Timema californicum]